VSKAVFAWASAFNLPLPKDTTIFALPVAMELQGQLFKAKGVREISPTVLTGLPEGTNRNIK
jgi:hypothetical protein